MSDVYHHGIEHEIQQIYDLLGLEVTMMLLLSNLTTRKLLKYHSMLVFVFYLIRPGNIHCHNHFAQSHRARHINKPTHFYA